jgi:hypothetical protein
MSQLGRIGGQVLTDNLLRAGVDLAFETSLLYLDVTNKRIGIRKTTPAYDLDVNSNIVTNDLTVSTQANIGNIRITAPRTFSTSVGGIAVRIAGSEIFHDRLTTANLEFQDNFIGSFSNSNIILDPNGSGTVELQANTNITGNLAVSGNIAMNGNLTGLGTITIGDQTLDTVTVNTDFTQSIIPGDDLTYSLGENQNDSSPRRWAQLHTPDWTNIINLRPNAVIVSNQMRIDGVTNKISAIQSNEDIELLPDTGIAYIEQTKWQDNDITNLLNTPLTFASTGIGYYNFNQTNAVLIPAGPTADQRPTPEVGETRWNTDLGLLECYNGTIWAVATGGGEEVTTPIMEDLSNVWALILG